MAGENITRTDSYVTAADLSAKKYYIGAVDASGNLALGSAGTDFCIGVIQDGGTASGDIASVATEGIVMCVAGVAINEGDMITSGAAGKAASTTTANNKCIGMAVSAAAADGDLFLVDMSYKCNY